MSPEQNDFRDLRRLLALKRHEQPPPGYFDGFSQQVIGRIRAGQRLEKEPLAARLVMEIPWLQRLWAALQTKPSVAGAFGVLVCGLLISVVLYSEHADTNHLTLGTPTDESAPSEKSLLAGVAPSGTPGVEFTTLSSSPSTLPKSDSLFEEIRHTSPWRLQQNYQQSFQATPQPVVERIPLGP
jgi:hypothetical protein